jgi:hypothetical protein
MMRLNGESSGQTSAFHISAGGRRAFRGVMLLEYGPERYFEAGAGTKAI